MELFCQTPGHLPTRDQAQFRDHLRREHNTNISSSAEDIEVFQRPVISPHGECNLCLAKTSNVKRHVSRHLRQIALFAIPRADYSTGDDAGDESTQAMHYSTAGTTRSSGDSSSLYLGATSAESSDADAPDDDISTIPKEPPETTKDSHWEEIRPYGVLDARDGRSEAPPETLPKFAHPEAPPQQTPRHPKKPYSIYVTSTTPLHSYSVQVKA